MVRLGERAREPLRLDDGIEVRDYLADTQWRDQPGPAIAGEPGFPDRRDTLGLVDLQVNGFAGIDFNDEGLTAEALDYALAAMLASGVTGCLPTIITADRHALAARLRALDEAVAASRLGPWMVPGYHLEGPFLNPADGYAGCHPPAAMIAASPSLVEEIEQSLSRPILLVTIAPEVEGAIAFIEWAASRGKRVAIGHSRADDESLAQAVAAGLSLSTHLGNGLPQQLPKLANPLFAQLAEDRLTATFIADGIHVPRPALKAMIRAKGVAQAVLVTDATAAAAARPGLHPFAGMQVELTPDGSVRQPGSRYLAGSALQLDRGLRNVVAMEIATPREGLRMACGNPRRIMADPLARHGRVFHASHLLWDGDLNIVEAAVGPYRIVLGE
ncbi:N-acetylglucosamine-6-phosphate deacetylase [Chelatococcus sp. GCM10030263]|uniref:N-acetylglucosamine-6-phosphate deacetylase n=1 Tax=Chelatococcus sp. GCM10030263 TaxID=3273387 RepID=UPI00361E320A